MFKYFFISSLSRIIVFKLYIKIVFIHIVCYAKAVYDYEACEDEELSFSEGDIIMVTSCQVDDDDGWWEGVLNGKKGVFPSIVVEETTPPADRPVPRQRAQTDQFNYGRSGVGSVADAGRTYSMINER